MTVILIDVRGTPAPQGSKYIGRNRNVIESSKAVGPWREAVRAETQRVLGGAFTFSGAVDVTIVFRMPRPKGHYRTGRNAHLLRDGAPRRPAGKPDIDKLARAVLDGLTDGGAWKDDGQVVTLTVDKVYAAKTPGCLISITEPESDIQEQDQSP